METDENMLCYKNRDIGGVIFDMDGTLIDSLSSYHFYLNKSLEGIGLQPISRDLLFKYLGKGISLKDILCRIIPQGRGDHVVETVAKEILRRFMKIDMDIPLLPGVREVFAFLKAEETRIGLATGRTSGAAYEWERLKNLGLDNFIDAIVTASEVGNRKPAPDLITECARKWV